MTSKTLYPPGAPDRPAIELDEDGFLRDMRNWTRQTARTLAELDGLGPLGPDHWAIIFYLREHHESYGSLPPMSQVCRSQHLERHAVQRLFGSCREAWRIAGLPNPGEEAKAYM
jgi:TusE/DsrC/DsvC family sulfur relay protein